MTLAEAAGYLRLPEDAVVREALYETLPGRKVGTEWRFLRSALQQWLSTGRKMSSQEAFLAFAGSWKDDPTVPEMLEEIYRQRGRPMVDDGT
jgi:excisionase family DNA binding protein